MKFILTLLVLVILCAVLYAQPGWKEKESQHFKLIYKEEHSFLSGHILSSAEKSLELLSGIFGYSPSEKIIINTYDINDYGFASATTVPENFIRLEIEPFEPGYENVPYNDRFQWILSHELVHIVLNDQATTAEKISRFLFSKVSPEQVQPMTVLYSLLSNYSRYTSRWHQESPAVFMESWMSGGFGRVLGSFDEMYFRSLVYEGVQFPSDVELDAVTSHNSFLLESLFYIYGGRFAAYLALKYGTDKLIKWYKVDKGDFYPTIGSRFRDAFGSDLTMEWKKFIEHETSFQKKNIAKILSAPVTPVKLISGEPSGWITNAYFTRDRKLIFASHGSHRLASIRKLNVYNSKAEELTTLPSPSMYQVASVAFDSTRGFLFYTTNNNQLYRDVWVYDVNSGDKKELFPDLRIGQMSVCPLNGDLWGIQHISGKTNIVVSPYPYDNIYSLYSLYVPDEINQLCVNPAGTSIAAVIHRGSGIQQLVIADTDTLKKSGKFLYKIITDAGTPENPSWSPDGKYLFWNSYVNGVSNLYRCDLSAYKTEALTNTIRGLFRPVMLNKDTLLAFEFTSEGFVPCFVYNKPAERLAAINYLGQEVLNANPKLTGWSLPEYSDTIPALRISKGKSYNGLLNLGIQAFIPVISGFQSQKVLGFFGRISDPLIYHDLMFEVGYSPFNENPAGPKYHVKVKYEFMKRLELGVDYNAPDFYDLFNKRKRGTIGTKLRAGYTHYWLYDNPHKIKQNFELAVYTDYEYINDNVVRVTEPDFGVAQTIWNSKNLRRSIGSSDFEQGDDFTSTVMVFGSDPQDPQFAGSIHAEWDKYMLYLFPHNVFHYKLAAGYHHKNSSLMQAMFYFGGFGNRELENVDVKQYRSVFRFPGIPIYSLSAERFVKLTVENNFPPIRFSNAEAGQHYLSHIDLSVFAQGLLLKTAYEDKWVDAGIQLNFVLKHWFNLESTISGGIAKAWSGNLTDWDWFLSLKLLKN